MRSMKKKKSAMSKKCGNKNAVFAHLHCLKGRDVVLGYNCSDKKA